MSVKGIIQGAIGLIQSAIGNSGDAVTDGTIAGYVAAPYIHTGTARGAISTRIQLAATASSADGAYDPARIFIVSGTGAGQCRQIYQYDGTNRYVYVDRDWKVTPDTTSVYAVMEDSGDTHVNEGLARGGGTNTITLNTLASNISNAYQGQMVFIRAGAGADQSRMVISYNGITQVATIDGNWTTQPDNTSIYAILPFPGFVHGRPDADSAANVLMRDVVGSKSDTVAGTSLVSLVKVLDAVADAIKAITDNLPDSGALTSIAQDSTVAKSADLTTVDTVVDGIKTVTDALPDSGALTSLAQGSDLATVDTVVDDIKAVTDNLPNSGALTVPTADSATNADWGDVIGNKTDTVAGNSLVSLIKGASSSQFDSCQFTGTVRYVSKSGDDANSGLSPDDAYLTIGTAITASAAGDAIRVGAGTYDEAGLDIDETALELWLEAGVILQDSADGTVLTISGNFANVRGSGNVRIDPTGGATGVAVTGNLVFIENLRVLANSVGAIGFDITGDGAEIHECRCSDPTTAAYKVQGDKALLDGCCTGGNTTSIGYWITNSCDKFRLRTCGSQGHQTAGFQVDTGCTNGVIWEFSSGGGDGKWTDADNTTVISELSYERVKYAYSIFTATGGIGGTGTNYNIFKITGSVKVFNIFGHVTTATPATASDVNLELYSTNAAVDITKTGDPNLASRVVGTVLARESTSGDPLEIGEPDGTPAIIENTNYRDPSNPITLIEDDAADTYIQVVLSAALASGQIHWHIEWEPITDDGFVEVV